MHATARHRDVTRIPSAYGVERRAFKPVDVLPEPDRAAFAGAPSHAANNVIGASRTARG